MSFITQLSKTMQITKRNWLSIALVNLGIVAFLGMILRSKILFSIPFLDFKYTLHAHSHFAFGGWVTLAILTLMVYEILPRPYSSRPVYKWLLAAILLNALGMLFSFLLQGYAFFSILFSTVFIFVTYVFAWTFIRDLYRASANRTVKLLCIGGLVYMILSSVGPFTLAHLIATKSANAVLYKDAIYTYLHLQYNGFFTLSIFALFLNRVEHILPHVSMMHAFNFSRALNLSVIPSMFLCYLWHYPNLAFYALAMAGSLSILLALIYFLKFMLSSKKIYKQIDIHAKRMVGLSFMAFVLKMIFQSLTIFKVIGELVFSNRPIIIGFLHLVLLGFISLYLLAHFYHTGLFDNKKLAATAGYLFATAIILNEIALMGQGLGIMLSISSPLFAIALWAVSICLVAGAVLLVIARYNPGKKHILPADSKIVSKKGVQYF